MNLEIKEKIQNYLTRNELWYKEFLVEEKRIKELLGGKIIDIQHIGSTSIPGLSAKPIIDMMVLTESITDIKNITEPLEKIGYIYKPEMSSSERIFLRKGEPAEYHLSISESKYPYWTRQILFRDYLRKHPESRDEYQKIKEDSIKNLSEDALKDISKSKEYNSQKGPFIQKILKLAEAELENKSND